MRDSETKVASSFTLLELLVVVAIISVLTTLILPSLATAKEKARRAKCTSNLKQIGVAFTLYLGDYNDLYPRQSDSYYTFYSWGGKQGAGIVNPLTTNQTRLLNPYMANGPVSINDGGSLLVFRCPSDDGAELAFPSKAMKPSAFDAWGNSYAYNCMSRAHDFEGSLFGRKATEIKNPANMVAANDLAFNYYYSWSVGVPVPMYWHEKHKLGAGNVLFADWHVGYFRAKMDGTDFERGNGWTFIYDDR